MLQFNRVLIGVFLCLPLSARGETAGPTGAGCESLVSANAGLDPETTDGAPPSRQAVVRDALHRLHRALPDAFPNANVTTQEYFQVLGRLLVAANDDDSDLVKVAFVGPANGGKSTLLNAIPSLALGVTDYAKEHVLSPPNRKAGSTKRSLILLAESARGTAAEAELFKRYPDLQPYRRPEDLETEGPPLLVHLSRLDQYPNLAFGDLPDVSTGDRRVHKAPVNLGRARSGLLAAEVLFVFLNDDNVNDFPLATVLAENFEKFGVRHAVFFLKTTAKREDHMRQSGEFLAEAARSILGQAIIDDRLPDAILGLYAIPDDYAVRRGEAHPELVPFKDSVPFPMLIDKLAAESAQIRDYAARRAAELIYDKVGGELDDSFKARYVADIYRLALDGVAAVPPETIAFPYDAAPDAWRATFGSQRAAPLKLLDKTAELSAKVLKMFPKVGRPEAAFEKMAADVNTALKAAWRNRIEVIRGDLEAGRARMAPAHAARVTNLMRTYNRLFPNDPIELREDFDGATGLTTLTLPRANVLAPDARAAVNQITSGTVEQRLNQAFKDAHDRPRFAFTEAEVADGLRFIHAHLYAAGLKARDAILDSGSTALGSALSVKGGAFAMSSAGVGGLVSFAAIPAGLVVVGGVRTLLTEREIDKALKPRLNRWFAARQIERYSTGIDEGLLRAARSGLAGATPPPRQAALAEVQKTLRVLGAPVPAYPADLVVPAGE